MPVVLVIVGLPLFIVAVMLRLADTGADTSWNSWAGLQVGPETASRGVGHRL